MIVFNMLMFTSFALIMFVLIVVQAYVIIDIIKELRRGMDFEYFVCLIGIIGTSLATIGLVIGITTVLLTGEA